MTTGTRTLTLAVLLLLLSGCAGKCPPRTYYWDPHYPSDVRTGELTAEHRATPEEVPSE